MHARYANAVVENRDLFKRKNLPAWYGEVWTNTGLQLQLQLAEHEGEIPEQLQFSLEILRDMPEASRYAVTVIERLSQSNKLIFENPDRSLLPQTKFEELIKIARQLHQSKNYQEIANASSMVYALQQSAEVTPLTAELLGNDIRDLYLLICNEDKFLIGTKKR